MVARARIPVRAKTAAFMVLCERVDGWLMRRECNPNLLPISNPHFQKKLVTSLFFLAPYFNSCQSMCTLEPQSWVV